MNHPVAQHETDHARRSLPRDKSLPIETTVHQLAVSTFAYQSHNPKNAKSSNSSPTIRISREQSCSRNVGQAFLPAVNDPGRQVWQTRMSAPRGLRDQVWSRLIGWLDDARQ